MRRIQRFWMLQSRRSYLKGAEILLEARRLLYPRPYGVLVEVTLGKRHMIVGHRAGATPV